MRSHLYISSIKLYRKNIPLWPWCIADNASHRFWLPSFLSHKYVALRFVPQSDYESAAPLDIIPQPDVVTRVFMLFKGVSENYLDSDWSKAVARAGDDVGWWRDVVGVNIEQARDSQLFRVLEWGGMEV